MAGTPHAIDRERTAELLGFRAPVANAMDAVSARDHLQEAVAACAICAGHLSRMAEELVLWSSSEFGFLRMAEAYATGSSIMPNKRNPDGAELVRGATGRVFGALQALLVLTKGLPMAYNRDLQEERTPLLEGTGRTLACLQITAAMWRTCEVDRERFESELWGDPSLATELADLLVDQGVLELANGGAARRFHESLPEDLGPWLDPRAATERRSSAGGTAWNEVAAQIAALRSACHRDR